MASDPPTTQLAADPSKDGGEGVRTPDAGNNGSKPATGDVTALEAKLKEKEKLVGALTKRLEQAAEQLDRLQRSGAKKGGRGRGGGLPAELVEEQKTLTEDLKRAVEQWEAMQAAFQTEQNPAQPWGGIVLDDLNAHGAASQFEDVRAAAQALVTSTDRSSKNSDPVSKKKTGPSRRVPARSPIGTAEGSGLPPRASDRLRNAGQSESPGIVYFFLCLA